VACHLIRRIMTHRTLPDLDRPSALCNVIWGLHLPRHPYRAGRLFRRCWLGGSAVRHRPARVDPTPSFRARGAPAPTRNRVAVLADRRLAAGLRQRPGRGGPPSSGVSSGRGRRRQSLPFPSGWRWIAGLFGRLAVAGGEWNRPRRRTRRSRHSPDRRPISGRTPAGAAGADGGAARAGRWDPSIAAGCRLPKGLMASAAQMLAGGLLVMVLVLASASRRADDGRCAPRPAPPWRSDTLIVAGFDRRLQRVPIPSLSRVRPTLAGELCVREPGGLAVGLGAGPGRRKAWAPRARSARWR